MKQVHKNLQYNIRYNTGKEIQNTNDTKIQ